jgi:hypothetical protein
MGMRSSPWTQPHRWDSWKHQSLIPASKPAAATTNPACFFVLNREKLAGYIAVLLLLLLL